MYSVKNPRTATYSGPRLNIKTLFLRYGIPMVKIRRSWDRRILNMGIPIMVRRHLYIETAPLALNVSMWLLMSFLPLQWRHVNVAVSQIPDQISIKETLQFRTTGSVLGDITGHGFLLQKSVNKKAFPFYDFITLYAPHQHVLIWWIPIAISPDPNKRLIPRRRAMGWFC